MRRFNINKLVLLLLLLPLAASSQRIRLLNTYDSIEIAKKIDSLKSENSSIAPSWSAIVGKPYFSLVATSNDYNDLLNQPNLTDYLLKSDSSLFYSRFSGDTSRENLYNILNSKVDKIAGKSLSTEDYTTTEKTKLSGIATGATANSSDATLLNRANHTGTQLAATISDFDTQVRTMGDTRYLLVTGTYANPPWITSLAYSKLTGVPVFSTSYSLPYNGNSSYYLGGDSALHNLANVNISTFVNNVGYISSYTETDPLALKKSNNLSDLNNISTARTNLGLGTLATQSGTFSGTSSGTNTGDETTTRINTLYGYTPANVGSISLATPNVIFSTPVSFTNTSGVWAGTLALNSQTTNKIFASPNGSTGTPSFRALVSADIPDISATYATQTQLTTTNSNLSSNTTAISTINTRTAHDLGSYSKSGRDAISSPAIGDRLFQTDDGWYEYYDAFWGWMPMYESNEWKAKYGTSWYDPLHSNAGTLTSRTTGTGSAINYNNYAGSLTGAAQMSTGSTSTGIATLTTGSGGLNAGFQVAKGLMAITCFVSIDQLSNATDEFIVISGFANTPSSIVQNSAAFFTYDRAGSNNGTSAQTTWQCVTSRSSSGSPVYTVVNTGVTVATSTVYKLQVLIAADGSTATFKINDVVVATISTNMPNLNVRIGTGIFKTAGTTSVLMRAWDAMFKEKFNTPR